jgi:hypothetical protein
MFLDDTAIGATEADTAIGGPLDTEPSFVYQPVMVAALCRLLDYAAWTIPSSDGARARGMCKAAVDIRRGII